MLSWHTKLILVLVLGRILPLTYILSIHLQLSPIPYTLTHMIGSLKGNVQSINLRFALIDVGGVGYKVYLSESTLSRIHEGEEIFVFTYLSVREDALDMYGFIDAEELDFFEMLLSVSGIGPKSAQTILSVTTVDTLKQAIGTGDTSYLTKVSGIGRKTAEKIVIELRDKLRAHADTHGGNSSLRAESDTIEALRALGYSLEEARDALRDIDQSLDTNAKIKEALKILGRK